MATEQNKQKIKEIIRANKWYSYEEAEYELKKHWNPDYDKNGDYLSMKRSQIQKILRSDMICTLFTGHPVRRVFSCVTVMSIS